MDDVRRGPADQGELEEQHERARQHQANPNRSVAGGGLGRRLVFFSGRSHRRSPWQAPSLYRVRETPTVALGPTFGHGESGLVRASLDWSWQGRQPAVIERPEGVVRHFDQMAIWVGEVAGVAAPVG